MCNWWYLKTPKIVLVKSTYEKNITDLIKEVTCMKKEKTHRLNNKTLDKLGI